MINYLNQETDIIVIVPHKCMCQSDTINSLEDEEKTICFCRNDGMFYNVELCFNSGDYLGEPIIPDGYEPMAFRELYPFDYSDAQILEAWEAENGITLNWNSIINQ